ncbi:MAG: helix-hairpin-helix domain-containing protein, partial [Burkholderiaceae bacterium]|nr:helix-hairpin-helix domain-containing protein [Burkholderiaceae bacterium]
MALTNADIAAAFEEIADLLELQDANPFRVRAYRNAARLIGDLKLDLAATVAAGKPLPKLPGVGADLAGKIEELARTGKLSALERLRRQVPAGITELLRLPGLGPKRVRTLYERLHVHTPEQVLRAARDGRIRELPGFGAKTESRLAEAIGARLAQSRRVKLAVAAQYAAHLIDWLRRAPGVRDVVAAGSLRRAKETVGDIDLLATAEEGTAVVQHFARHPDAAQVLAAGDTRGSLVLKSGLQVDLRVVPPASFGAALLYFTGSKAHNIRLRNLALARGLKLNEYGLFRGRRALAAATEEEIYAALDL